MKNKKISNERKKYLKKLKTKNILIIFTQLAILIGFLAIWEALANAKIIDSFITSQPSRIFDTLIHLGVNDLGKHIGVTVYETVVGFLLGTIIGIIVAIVLWWSDFLSKVAEPYLVVLNSLPKVALRANYYYMGWCRNTSNYNYGNFNIFNCYYSRKFKWIS